MKPAIVARLRACPTREITVSRELFLESWGELQREDVTLLAKPTQPVMAALLLYDERFGRLLNAAERSQLQTLVEQALDRYQDKIHPLNPLGKLLAGLNQQE